MKLYVRCDGLFFGVSILKLYRLVVCVFLCVDVCVSCVVIVCCMLLLSVLVVWRLSWLSWYRLLMLSVDSSDVCVDVMVLCDMNDCMCVVVGGVLCLICVVSVVLCSVGEIMLLFDSSCR